MPYKTPRFIYGNGFNPKNGLLKTRPIVFYPQESYASFTKLSKFCRDNFFSLNQGYNLIKKKLLLAFKFKGSWYVRINPNCNLEDLSDGYSCRKIRE